MGLDDDVSGDYDEDFVKIAEHEGASFMEFPKEENETILLSTIQAQFPHAIGLKYKGSSGAWRAIREADNVLDAPKGGWGDRVYYLSLNDAHTKGRPECNNSNVTSPLRKIAPTNQLLQDLAVIGLPFKTTEEELRTYFESNYGDLAFCEIKMDRETGKSRGFGFIRFKDEAAAKQAVNGHHYIEGRRVEVRMKKDKPMKMFIGRVPHGTTVDDLNRHFSQYGQLTDTYIPTPFRNYAFITFASSEDAKNCMQDTHMLNGNRLNVIERNERNPEKDRLQKEVENGGGFGTEAMSMFRAGYGTKYNPREMQGNFMDYTAQNGVDTSAKQNGNNNNNMDSDLRNMLYQFLANQKL